MTFTLPTGTLHLGDALDLMRRMPAECIDLIVTDPPYRTISGGKNGAEGYGWRNSVLSENDGRIFAHNDITPDQYLPECYRLLKPGTHLYLMSNTLNLRDMWNALEQHGFHVHNLLRWDKNNKTANRWYMKDCEWTLFAAKRPVKPINMQGSCQGFTAKNPRNKRHKTEKPVELMEHYILNSSEQGNVVLDPFMGSGTTCVAAERTGRRWIGMESDPQHYYPAVGRVWSECHGTLG